ncbi:AAA family ATPase [Halobacteriaceae archaeon GCM10025711]
MIVLVCGPPGVGKTTVTTMLQQRLADETIPVRVLHSDDYGRHPYDRMFEAVQGSDAHWLLDGTFYKREWREQFRRLDDVRVVSLRASEETCVRRNREREDPISERGVHVVWREFEEPDADLTVDTDDLSPEVVVECVFEAWQRWTA